MKNKINIVSVFSMLAVVFVLTHDIINYCFSDNNITIELTEEDSEEDVLEKGIKYLFVYNVTEGLSHSVSIQLKHNLRFLHSLYKNPFIPRDTKPPHFA